LTKSWIRQF